MVHNNLSNTLRRRRSTEKPEKNDTCTTQLNETDSILQKVQRRQLKKSDQIQWDPMGVALWLIVFVCTLFIFYNHPHPRRKIESLINRNAHRLPSQKTKSVEQHIPERTKPRYVGCFDDSEQTDVFQKVRRLDTTNHYVSSGTKLQELDKETPKEPEYVEYATTTRISTFETDDCVAMHEWQKHSFPTCNDVHAINLPDLLTFDDEVHILGSGTWRVTWLIKDYKGDNIALKSYVYKYHQPFGEWHINQHRKDGLVYERLSNSPHVIQMYSHCVMGGLFEFADGGTMEDNLWSLDSAGNTLRARWSGLQRLRYATQAALGVADLHDVNQYEEGAIGPAVAHTDISLDQFISLNGVYKLSDFNRVYFMRRNVTSDEPCGYHVDIGNPGSYRSPEEMIYSIQTEKVDLYALGSVIYSLLTNFEPFKGLEREDYMYRIFHGEQPIIPDYISHSPDPAKQAMIRAMGMCRHLQPEYRASAAEVASFLSDKLSEIESGRTG